MRNTFADRAIPTKITPRSVGVQLAANVSTMLTPALTYTVPARQAIIIPDLTEMVLKLFEAAPAELDPADVIQLAASTPGNRIGERSVLYETDYEMFEALTLAEQQNSENKDALRINLPSSYGGQVILSESDQLILLVQSVDVVSWPDSSFQIKVNRIQLV